MSIQGSTLWPQTQTTTGKEEQEHVDTSSQRYDTLTQTHTHAATVGDEEEQSRDIYTAADKTLPSRWTTATHHSKNRKLDF